MKFILEKKQKKQKKQEGKKGKKRRKINFMYKYTHTPRIWEKLENESPIEREANKQ